MNGGGVSVMRMGGPEEVLPPTSPANSSPPPPANSTPPLPDGNDENNFDEGEKRIIIEELCSL